jgi:monofunctional biosynthetic peptidoglycan transglycosylase
VTEPAPSVDHEDRPRRRRRIARAIGRGALYVIAAAVLLPLLLVVLLRWVDPPTSAFMIQRAFERRFAEKPSPPPRQRIEYRWTDLDAIAPSMALAVVAAEDQLFPQHHGFDVDSIRDAMDERERRRRVRGASTITQQVAKNLFLWPGRSFLRKGIEAALAATIEVMWPKRRILEVYLNIAETGPDLYGVGAAAEVYFQREPAKLTRRQAALIAAALPNPAKRRPDRPGEWLAQRASWIEAQMEQLGGTAHLAGILDVAR